MEPRPSPAAAPAPDLVRDLDWRVVPAAQFAEAIPAWDRIVAERGYPPFMRSEVIAAALAEFGSGREVVATAERDGRIVAAGVLVRTRFATWETFQPSQIPLGALVQEAGVALGVALGGLARALPGYAAIVAVTQQDPAFVTRPADSPRLRTIDYIDTARVAVEGSFEGYWAARGKNLRTNDRRQHAKLAADGVAVRFDEITEAGAVAAAIAEYGALESAGWKAGGGTAISPDNAQGRFYRSVFETFCARGAGRIFRCLFDDAPVAIDLAVEEAGMLVILKTTYDERWKSVSPASLLRRAYFSEVFGAGRVRAIEFYGKVMEWHRRWTDDVRTLYHVNAYRNAGVRSLHERLVRRSASARMPASAEAIRSTSSSERS